MLRARPIMTAVIGYIIGIIMGLYCKISIVFLYLLLPIIKLYKPQKRKFKLISLKRYSRYLKIIFTSRVLKIIIIFSIISNSITLYQNNKYKKIYTDLENQEITITAKVVSNSKEKNGKYVYKIKTKNNIYFYLSVKNNQNYEFDYGDKITIVAKYSEPSENTNYMGFNYKEYLKTLKIYGTLSLSKVEKKEKSAKTIFTISNQIFLKIKEFIQSNFESQTGNVLLGLTLGYTDEIESDIKSDFKESNISYILAVSGMHVAYITVCTKFILEKIIGKRNSKIGVSIILIMYMFITGFSPSIVRAGITGIIAMLSGVFYKRNDTWENLSFSLLILLIYNPFLIKSTSLILSFAGTIGILILYQNLKSVTVSASLFVMPIMARCFNKIAISSLLISMIVGVIIGPIIMLGFIFDIFVIIQLTKLGNWGFIIFIKKMYIIILDLLLKLVIFIAQLGSKLPFNSIYITTPSILKIAVYYFTILIRKFFIFNIS